MKMKVDDLQTVDDLLEADWSELVHLKKKELQSVITHYAKIANERRSDAIKKLRESELPTPLVYKSTKSKEGADNVSWYRYGFNYRRGSKVDEMRKKLRLIRQFLSDKTTTFEGWKEVLDNFVDRVSEKADIVVTKRKYKQYWNIYLKAQERPIIMAKFQSKKGSSDELQRAIIDIIHQDSRLLWDEDMVIAMMEGNLEEIDRLSREQKNKVLANIDEEDDDDDEGSDDSSFYYNPF